MRGSVRALSTVLAAGALATTGVVASVAVGPAVPRPDHVVVVVMENHAAEDILGSPEAPYINHLGDIGANMTQSYGLTHPSQPNYIGLFSGTLNGVTDNTCPQTLAAPNLGAQLIGAGFTFAGYSESMPSAGYTGCGSGTYARKHNPWVDFPSVPAESNQPLTSFPTDFTTLPTVSFVVPNLQNDMHDGTVNQGDAWLQDHLGDYVTWAMTHNSVLVLIWDEDANNSNNHIPTVIVGAGVRAGDYAQRIDHYNVLRTLQDAYGLPPIANSGAAAPILDIWNSSPGTPPVASFTAQCTTLTCQTDGAASADPDGSVSGYQWNWGDGSAIATGPTSSHTYAAPGTYVVTLTVSDDSGLIASTTRSVTATPSGAFVFARDGFDRTTAAGWGTAETGGPWTVSGSTTSVGGGTAKIRLATGGSGPAAYLTGVSAVSVDASVAAALDKPATGSGTYLTLKVRHSGSTDYDAKVRWAPNGQLNLYLSRIVAGAETTLRSLTLPGISVVPGDVFRIRLQADGTSPTTLNAKVWRVGTPEPAAWQLTATDSTVALQSAGSVGVQAYVSSGATSLPQVASFDDLLVTAVSAPANQSPTAVLTLACEGLACNTDGRTSTDPDGSIASYTWDWGDGTTPTTGSTAGHAYAAGGSYVVALTVADNGGATGMATKPVTVAEPVNQPPPAALTVACTALSCSGDSAGSADPDGSVTAYSWNWGDGTAATTGITSPHTFAAAGTYLVALTVTDDRGRAGTASRSVTVTAPPGGTSAFATDLFNRSAANGWGSADLGGAWTVSGTKSNYSVESGTGSMRLAAGSTLTAYLAAVSRVDTDLTLAVTTDKAASGNGTYVTVTGRRVATNTQYDARLRLRPDGTVTLALSALKGTSTVVYLRPEAVVAGLSAPVGVPLRVRLQVTGTGPTTLRAKVWPSTLTEPSVWQATATDTTGALQAPGAVGVTGYVSGASTNAPIVLRVSDLSARPT